MRVRKIPDFSTLAVDSIATTQDKPSGASLSKYKTRGDAASRRELATGITEPAKEHGVAHSANEDRKEYVVGTKGKLKINFVSYYPAHINAANNYLAPRIFPILFQQHLDIQLREAKKTMRAFMWMMIRHHECNLLHSAR